MNSKIFVAKKKSLNSFHQNLHGETIIKLDERREHSLDNSLSKPVCNPMLFKQNNMDMILSFLRKLLNE